MLSICGAGAPRIQRMLNIKNSTALNIDQSKAIGRSAGSDRRSGTPGIKTGLSPSKKKNATAVLGFSKVGPLMSGMADGRAMPRNTQQFIIGSPGSPDGQMSAQIAARLELASSGQISTTNTVEFYPITSACAISAITKWMLRLGSFLGSRVGATCLSVFLAALLCSTPVWATTHYVNKLGNDSNSCLTATSATATNAKLTISGAAGGMSCTSGGDTLIIADGTYVEAIRNTIPAGSAGSPTIIKALNRGTCGSSNGLVSGGTCNTILKPTTGNNVIRMNANYITLDGLEADSTSVNSSPIDNYNGGTGVNHLTVQYSHAHGGHGDVSSSSGIAGGCDNCTIIHNESDHNDTSTNQDHGIYEVGNATTIAYNYVWNNGGYCLHLYPTMTNSLIYSNTCTGTVLRGSIVQGSSGNKYYNNLHYANAQGLEVTGDSNLIANNSFYNNGGGAGCITVTGSTNSVNNNICFGNTDNTINAGTTPASTLKNSTANPMWTNAPSADFTLIAGSPDIDSGLDLSASFTTDIVGTVRPQCAAFDVGAYEYVGCSSPPLLVTDPFAYTLTANLDTQNGGTGWTGAWAIAGIGAITIETAPAGAPSTTTTRSQSATGTVLYTRAFTPITAGTFSWYMRTDDCSPSDFDGVYLTSSGNGLMYVQFQAGSVKAYDNLTAAYVIVGTCTVNTWIPVVVNFNNAVTPNVYRVSINGGAYSADLTVNGGTLTPIDGFYRDDSSTDAHTTYLTSIGGVPQDAGAHLLTLGVR